MTLFGSPLTSTDYDMLARSGISRELAERALLRRVDSFSGAKLVGRNGRGDYAGIVFPYHWPGEDHIRQSRLRRDHPDLEVDEGGRPKEKRKYLSPPGGGNLLYLPPDLAPEWLQDTSLSIVLTEGEKKGLAVWGLTWSEIGEAAERPPFLAIAVAGVWNWRGNVAKAEGPDGSWQDVKGPIPDLDRIAWLDRTVTILFDSNVHTNKNVSVARDALAATLRKCGARVLYADLPADLGINGIDDYIGRYGPKAALHLIESAYEPKPGATNRQTIREHSGPAPRPKPKPLAKEAFQGIAGEFVRLVAPHTEAHPAALLFQLLVAVGILFGRYLYYRVGSDRHHANQFLVLVGRTGKGRKGVSWGFVRQLLLMIEETFRERILSGLSSGEGVIAAVRDERKDKSAVRKGGRVVEYEDVIVESGVEDKRLLIVEPEFARTLRVSQREGNTVSAVLREAYDSGDLGVLTKERTKATGAHIGIIAHITEDELRRFLPATEMGNGFANRHLFVYVERSQILPFGGDVDEEKLRAIAKKLETAMQAAQQQAREGSSEVAFDEEARADWIAVYPALSAETPGLLGALTNRAEAHVVRLALLYALLDGKKLIERPHLEAAIAVWDYANESTRYIFGGALGDETADVILDALRKAGATGLIHRQIFDLFSRNKPATDIHRALRVLSDGGFARMEPEKPQGPGRPSERWLAVELYELNKQDEQNTQSGGISSFDSYPEEAQESLDL